MQTDSNLNAHSRRVFLALLAGLCLAAPARADLRITEIWPGGLPGDELTSDWIELTNFGQTAINNLEDYHYRDSVIPDGVQDGLYLGGGELTGVTTLLPGESAVFLAKWEADLAMPDGTLNTSPTLQDAIDAFMAMWGFQEGDIKLGWMLDDEGTGGPGLSANGDDVVIYDGDYTGSSIVDHQSFPESDFPSYVLNPDTMAFGELAEAGVYGAREGLRPGCNQQPDPPVGSPGVVPEPATMSVLALGAIAAVIRRRRK